MYILWYLFKMIQKLFKIDQDCYLSALLVFIYLLISSIAEPAFNNSVAIPLAIIIAISMNRTDSNRQDAKI